MRIERADPTTSKVQHLGSWNSDPKIALLTVISATILVLWNTISSVPASPGNAAPLERTTPLRRLTFDGVSTPLSWASDGRGILVKRPGKAQPEQHLSQLWLLSVLDADQHLIANNAFSAVERSGHISYLRYAGRDKWELIETDLDGSLSMSIGPAQWNVPPTWTDRGLVYQRRAGQLAIAYAASDDALLDIPLPLSTRVRLAPDGRAAAYAQDNTLWIADQQRSQAITQAEQISGFAWSPNGSQLAYVRSDDGPFPELWVWDRESDQAKRLARGSLEHFGTPAWSPSGGKLAFARHNTGSGPNAAGDIWLVDAKGTGLRPLAQTAADEHAPTWSPTGRYIAFALDGDTWIADLNAPDLEAAFTSASAAGQEQRVQNALTYASSLAGASLQPPDTIRVKHDAEGNTCRNVPDGQVDTYPFEEYVKRVVPYEVFASWPAETLKAQAVAARTYAWRKALDAQAAGLDYDVWDSTRSQYMCDDTYASTDAAVEATQGQYISFDDRVIYAFYCAETASPTNYRQELNLALAPYLRPVDDPVGFGQTRRGHSWGMSQWGAYRWASSHGWNYVQILAHYYSLATIEPNVASTIPLSVLTVPWPDTYLRSSYADLRTNAADPTQVLTVSLAAQITDTWTTIYTDTNPLDGWGHMWPIAHLSDTITASIGLKASTFGNAGERADSPLIRIGLDRQPPTGTLAVDSNDVTTLTLGLHLTAFDPPPTSGAMLACLGDGAWIWQDTQLDYLGGSIEPDPAATDGSAWRAEGGSTAVQYGPYISVLPSDRKYRALFRLKVPTAALTTTAEIATLDVAVQGEDTLLGIRYLHGTDFAAGGQYQEFAVDFEGPSSQTAIEFHTDVDSPVDLWLDRIHVVEYPITVTPTVSWTLPPGEGARTVLVKYADRAQNYANAITLPITVTDHQPPGEWSAFACTHLTCTIQVRDAIAGLDVSSAQYQLSTDDGVSWTDWITATCTGQPGSYKKETIAAAPIPSSLTARSLIRFRINDASAQANAGISPTYSLWRVHLPIILHAYP